MAYRFQLNEPFDAGFRRITAEQITKAQRLLSSNGNPVSAVHEGRKGLKRLRALLRLFRHALGKEQFKTENVRYRDIARTLSQSRDRDVILAILAGLRTDSELEAMSDGARRVLNCAIDSAYAAAATTLLSAAADGRGGKGGADANTDDSAALSGQVQEEARASLEDALDALEDIKLQRATNKCVGAGLASCYRRGALSLEHAIGSGVNNDLHEWRKDVQVHWRHMSLFKVAWPAYFAFRAETAKSLSDLLGRHHDLDLVIGFIDTLDGEILSRKSRQVLHDTIRSLQDRLRLDAIDLGEMLFADKPEEFAQRVLRYWKAARRASARRKENPGDAVKHSMVSDAIERGVLAQTEGNKP